MKHTLAIVLILLSSVATVKSIKPESYTDALQRANAVCHLKIDSKANPDAFSQCLESEMQKAGFN